MIPIKDLLNKIKWDKKLDLKDFSIFYIDRVSNEYIEIPYNKIKRIEGSFMIIEKDSEEVNIPLHRIIAVKELNKVVWNRK